MGEAVAQRLQPQHARAYVAARQRMLELDPWAFSASPILDIEAEVVRIEALLADDIRAIVGVVRECDAAVIATAGLIRPDREKLSHRVHVWGVWTDPDHRRQGLGREVMQAAIELARSWRGVVGIELSVREGGSAAIGLYESLGFRTWGIQPDAMRIGGVSSSERYMQLDFEGVG